MRLTDDTRFPHPVLSPESGDFGQHTFDVTFTCEEAANSGKVTLHYQVELDQPDIKALIEGGKAGIGAFVRCGDTFFSALQSMAWPGGSIEFQDGALLNRVAVRPIVWLKDPLSGWSPSGLADEFEAPLSLNGGEIIAFAPESVLSVGRAKLAPFESIFVIRPSDSIATDSIAVDLDAEKITILAGKNAYELIASVRGKPPLRSTAQPAIYLPAVMDVLDQLRGGTAAYEQKRWFTPFQARCDALGIDLNHPQLAEDAQRLLEKPIMKLESLLDPEA